jgi:hypothetical protein
MPTLRSGSKAVRNSVSISEARRAISPATVLTSFATTLNPRPASPERAASIVAFIAKRCVWAVMVWMSRTLMSEIPAAALT